MSTFGTLEITHPDPGTEFENKVMYYLQHILGFKKTRTTPSRPQGISVSERVYSTMHAMLAMHSSIKQDNWATLLPLVQIAHNTAFSTTIHENPYLFTFGFQAKLPVDISQGHAADTEELAKQTRDNLQLAFELVRHNPTNVQACKKQTIKQ